MILEAIVTTQDSQGVLNIAPMGPRVDDDGGMRTFLLRPFQTSTTFHNLVATREGVLHVTDDALLLARAAIGEPLAPPRRPAEVVRGQVLTGACHYFEFRVQAIDDREPRASITAVTVAEGFLRPFFGWNRARHAVLEAAILATRVNILPDLEINAQLHQWELLVHKTGGADEHTAFDLLRRHIASAIAARDTAPTTAPTTAVSRIESAP